jgi:Holliday junction resolvasome RuvABC endonuclease subunit
MKRILGLDISSATIGWAVLSVDDNKNFLLDSYGHIKPPSSSDGTLTHRIDSAYSDLKNLFIDISPDSVAIEAYANKFSSGRSSARTIMVLSVFNELSALACLRSISIEPYKYNVISIRSDMSKLFEKKIKSKDDVFDHISEYFENFNIRYSRTGKIRKECYDETDAIAVAICHYIRS